MQVFRRLSWYLPVCAVVVVAALAGCGYHAAKSAGDGPLGGGRSIAIPVFVNRSYRPAIELPLTECAVREFALRNGGRVLAVDKADLVLNGTIASYKTTPVAYSDQDKIREYRLDIVLEASLVERASRRVVWAAKLSEGQDFPVDADVNVGLQLNREEAALQDIGRRIAQRLYQEINQAF